MNDFLVATALFTLFCLSLFSLIRGKWFAAFLKGCLTTFGLFVSSLGLLVLWGISDFETLVTEQKIAEVVITELGPQHYSLNLVRYEQPEHQYEIFGDSWQLDARVVAWDGLPNWLTPPARFRLERLTGRYNDLFEERHNARSLFQLNDSRVGSTDSWLGYLSLVPGMSVKYGSSVYVPMKARANYEVWITQKGLIVRPSSQQAIDALNDWQ